MKNDMNDDFLHRLRVEPSRKFLAALKASLDRQALSQRKARRTLFRTAILAALIGGSAVAVAFVAWRGVPASLRITAHVASSDPPTQSRIIISAPSGGGAAMPNARTSGEGAAMPLGSVPLPPSPDAGAGAAAAAGANQSRTVFSVAGPTAVILNAQSVVRRPVETKMLQQPVFTLASSNDAIAMLCHVHASAGENPVYADIAGASRRILDTELEACKRNGITRVAELHAGFETVVLVRSTLYGAPKLSARDIFLALAAQVPDPSRPYLLIKNPYHVWNAIDGALSEDKIDILGPPLSSATAAAFRQTLMEAGCVSIPWIAGLKQSDLKRYEKVCRTMRDDGVYRDARGNLREQLETYPNAMALLDYREAAAKPDAYIAASVDGVEPGTETILAEKYAGARAMYLYVNRADVYNVPGMLRFVEWYVRSLGQFDSITTLVAPPRQADAGQTLVLQDMKF